MTTSLKVLIEFVESEFKFRLDNEATTKELLMRELLWTARSYQEAPPVTVLCLSHRACRSQVRAVEVT